MRWLDCSEGLFGFYIPLLFVLVEARPLKNDLARFLYRFNKHIPPAPLKPFYFSFFVSRQNYKKFFINLHVLFFHLSSSFRSPELPLCEAVLLFQFFFNDCHNSSVHLWRYIIAAHALFTRLGNF